MSKVLVTGAAGFVGFHLSRRLMEQGVQVVGLDNLNSYYSVQLKNDRLALLKPNTLFDFRELDLADREGMRRLFASEPFDRVVHLAAQAGVRYSLEHPEAYIDSNLVGFGNILEGCRAQHVKHLVYASSSSVYGNNREQPFSTQQSVDHPISLYAATKKANELMAHTYSHLFGIPTTGLRFFTVYGPWGRPDMALYKFTEAIENGRPIDVYNQGQMQRDFTYIDDIVESMVRVIELVPKGDSQWHDHRNPSTSTAPYRIFNIGNHQPVQLGEFIETLEDALGKKAIKNLLPMQPGDVIATYADVEDLEASIHFRPKTPIKDGIEAFVAWYRSYHGQKAR